MFKKLILCVVAIALVMGATACSVQNTDEVSESPVAEVNESYASENSPKPTVLEDCFQMETFNSEAEFNAAILKAREQNDGDVCALAEITEYYRPKNLLEGLSFHEIHVTDYYVSYWYWNKDHIDEATFTWKRTTSPGAAMNGIYDLGAMSIRDIIHNGIKYVFMEFVDPDTGNSGGYEVLWIKDDKVFGASIPSGFSDEEMLAFCDYEVVKVIEPSNNTQLKRPPEMQLQYTIDGQPHSVSVLPGTCSWMYDNDDGTSSGIEADSFGPLDSVEHMPKIEKTANLKELRINFTLTPDSYTVRCWHDIHIGDYDAYEQYETVNVSDNTVALSDDVKGYIYETYAKWPQGNAYYCFYVK